MDYSKDYYKVLGIDSKATKEQISSAYKKLIRKWHPDLFASKSKEEQEKATAMAAEINEANDILSDDEKRAEYDEVRSGAGRRFGGFRGFSGFGPGFDEADMDPIFNEIRRGNFHGFRSRTMDRTPISGKNIFIRVNLPFEDFFFGCKKTFDVKVSAKCSHCENGLTSGNDPEYGDCPYCGGVGFSVSVRGNMTIQQTCGYCEGRGKIIKNRCQYCNGTSIDGVKIETLEFEIPKGSIGSVSKTYEKKGHSGIYGGERGDITISASMGNDGAFFPIDENTLGSIHVISLFKALGGGMERILTPYGLKTVMIPSCMKDGHVIRYGGMGLKGGNGRPDGDLLVTFKYDMPESLDRSIIDGLSKIADKCDANPEAFPRMALQRESDRRYLEKLKSN